MSISVQFRGGSWYGVAHNKTFPADATVGDAWDWILRQLDSGVDLLRVRIGRTSRLKEKDYEDVRLLPLAGFLRDDTDVVRFKYTASNVDSGSDGTDKEFEANPEGFEPTKKLPCDDREPEQAKAEEANAEEAA